MSIAAVPNYIHKYLDQDITSASPGLRFGYYLPIWTDYADQTKELQSRAHKKSPEGYQLSDLIKQKGIDKTLSVYTKSSGNKLPQLWHKNDYAAQQAWHKICQLNTNDKATCNAINARQTMQASTLNGRFPNSILSLDAKAIAPFSTGLGNDHPLENGFAFLDPYGLPYLPGSSIKGVLRQAARELAKGNWDGDETHGWSNERTMSLANNPEIKLSIIDALFGRETDAQDLHQIRGALSFWDVVPDIAGDQLAVEIMTPHYNDYYQNGQTPHDSGQPRIINFLSVPAGSSFSFHVNCDLIHLRHIAPQLENTWEGLIQAAFQHAYQWCGFGAKTAVGYGAMAEDEKKAELRKQRAEEAKKAQQQELKQQQRQQEIAQMDPVDKEIAQFLDNREHQNRPPLKALLKALETARWENDMQTSIAHKMKEQMQEGQGALLWREKSAKKNPKKDEHFMATQAILKILQDK